MNGCRISGTPIVVDFWQNEILGEQKVFFLTHLHADHTRGLTSSWNFKFYTSPINSLLLKNKFQFQEGIVVPLELDEPHVVSIDNEDNHTITVTLIDANHVPGAVIFLFQGSFGNILYTGDMRFYPEIFEHPILKPLVESQNIDELYLDNTFLHPNYNFPSREVATQLIFDIIEKHPKHVIKLGVRSLGKEDLLEAIAQKFNSLICVDHVKYNQVQVLNRPKVYTTSISDTLIHAIDLHRIHARNHQKWNEIQPTICIRISAIEFGVPPEERSSANVEGTFTVPYSDHSSWSELIEFVSVLGPSKIIPIVKRNDRKKDRISLALQGSDDVSVLSQFLSSPRKRIPFVSIPVSSFISTCNSLKLNVNSKSLKHPNITRRKKVIQKGILFTSFEEDESSHDREINQVSNNDKSNAASSLSVKENCGSESAIQVNELFAKKQNNCDDKYKSLVKNKQPILFNEKGDELFATACNETDILTQMTKDDSLPIDSIFQNLEKLNILLKGINNYMDKKYL